MNNMENNWKEVVEDSILNIGFSYRNDNNQHRIDIGMDSLVENMLLIMNSVFEVTKKECADKAKIATYVEGLDDNRQLIIKQDDYIDKKSILNINKPNL